MILNLLSVIYRVVLILREVLFRIGLFKRKKLACFVVSVGNITLGGTGKTPCVESLANLIHSYGKKVSVISRGYKRKSKGLKVVSNGREILLSQNDSGDEAYYLAKTLKNIPVVVSKDRYKAGLVAIKKFLSEVIILDDGFQRRYSLRRDLDIVLIDSTNPFGNYRLFPAGILREPMDKLNGADVFILTKVDDARNKEELKMELTRIKNNCLILESVYNPVCFVFQDKVASLDFVRNKKVFLLSSIANPFYFERIIERLGAEIIQHLKYPDHYNYSLADFVKIENNFKNSKAEFLITTEKDAVRLHTKELPVYSLKIEFEILDGGKEKLVELFKSRKIV